MQQVIDNVVVYSKEIIYTHTMTLHLLPEGKDFLSPESLSKLHHFSLSQGLELTLEWKEGQVWLHSPDPGERPIGISIDRILERHEQYFKKSSLHKEVLARAIGIKGAHRPRLLDLSAGLLGDTLLFLSMGCEVMAIERHPLVAVLIRSALQNAQHPLLKNLTFLEAEAAEFLTRPAARDFEVIYFDPMFEDANEKSLPKKEMRIFRSLVGKDQDALAIFKTARKLAPRRLVVKRPRLSRALVESEAVVYAGKATRYDVYLSQNHGPNDSNQIK